MSTRGLRGLPGSLSHTHSGGVCRMWAGLACVHGREGAGVLPAEVRV